MGFAEAFEQIAENARIRNAPVEGDYIKDGLLHCHKCNTPKECVVMNPFIPNRYDKRSCTCKCRREEIAKAEAESRRRDFEKKVKRLRQAGFPDDEMQEWTFDKDDGANEHITSVARKYAENFEKMRDSGKGLLLYGTVGTGKTFAAACIANALIDRGFPCLVTNFSRLINTISGINDGKQKYIDALNDFTLLVLDDLASEADTEFRNEIVFNVIDSRYRAGLPFIITTNLTAQELKNSADIRKQRIYSRLFERCIPVEVKGADRRREKLKDEFQTYADLLGL